MNKKHLVAAVRENAGLSAYEAENAVSAMFDHITNALARSEEVALVGFGRFWVQNRAARTARNPSTGESMQVPERRSVRFRAGKNLKDL